MVYTYTGWWYTCPSKKHEFSWDDEIEQNEIKVPNNKPGYHGAAVLHEVFFSMFFCIQLLDIMVEWDLRCTETGGNG